MPMPLAAFLYGILLGLGFTTFVLSFGVWALAGISFALGEPAAGVAIGLAFGAGRALPVLALAPVCDRHGRDPGDRTDDPAPGDLPRLPPRRRARAGRGRRRRRSPRCPPARRCGWRPAAGEPSAARAEFVYQRAAGAGMLRRAGRERPAARSPAGDRRPLHRGRCARGESSSWIAAASSRRGGVRARRVDGVAVSGSWVAYRTRVHGRDLIRVRRIFHLGIGAGHQVGRGARPSGPRRCERRRAGVGGLVFGRARTVAASRRRGGLSRPSIYRRVLVYSSSSRRRSAVIERRAGQRAPPASWSPPAAGSSPSPRSGPLLRLRAHDQRAPAAAGPPPPRARLRARSSSRCRRPPSATATTTRATTGFRPGCPRPTAAAATGT